MIDLKRLPKDPGVYLFKDKKGDVIYIGKAKSLRKRVSSYFRKTNHSPKTELLVKQITDIDFIIVDNEVESLLLENKLIKKYKPKYNITLKDAKTFAYIKITDEKYPRIHSTRRLTKKGTYFGPYTDGSARHELVRLAVQLFKIRTCRTLPKRACLNYHIGLCTAPCIKAVKDEDYSEQVSHAKSFLKGNTKPVVKRLKKEMMKASEKMQYETALERKRQIESIEHLHERQKVDLVKRFDQDVLAYVVQKGIAHITLFSINKGVISGKKSFRFEEQDDGFASFVKLYYSQNYVPHELIVSEAIWDDLEDKAMLEKYLARIKGAKVILTCPLRGEKAALVKMAKKNTALEDEVLIELQQALNLPSQPSIIECFDISNLGREHLVAGMTRFVHGKPDKNGYRKFEIKSFHGKNDDYASMREVVYRRYRRLIDEEKELPHLIVIDGGPGQLSAALESLHRLHVHIPIVSLAKKEEELYIPGNKEPLHFDKNSPMMLMLRKIRDSVHNLAVRYNRKKREMAMRRQGREEH